MGLDLEEAEKIKADKSRAREVMGLVRPVIDKISAIVEQHLKPWPGVETIHLVGGTCELEGLDRVMAENLGRRVERPLFPQAVTPLVRGPVLLGQGREPGRAETGRGLRRWTSP